MFLRINLILIVGLGKKRIFYYLYFWG